MADIEINKNTLVVKLLEAYPLLEEIMIEMVPSLEQSLADPGHGKEIDIKKAAMIGNLDTDEFVSLIRKLSGEDDLNMQTDGSYSTVMPEWFDKSLIRHVFDARVMLGKGEKPEHKVMEDFRHLPHGEIYELIMPYVPLQIIKKATGLGLEHWVKVESDEYTLVYIFKKQ